MKHKQSSLIVVVIAIFTVILACTGSAPEESSTQPAVNTLIPVTEFLTNSPPPEIPIQHQVFPVNLPPSRSGNAGDQDSSVTANQKKSNGGDRFTFEQFERPFSSNTMDVYYPNLDIIDTNVFQDETWIYGTIKVVDRSAATVPPYRLAMQLDIDVDGKGDWLILVLNPSSSDWTTDGVQAYFDANSDVGNQTPMRADKIVPGGDGFEQIIFDQGKGEDPDSAWVRASPNDANTVEIAAKRSLLGNPIAFMVHMWTGHGTLDPALFDYSDHYSHEQAGAADPSFPFFYPIKTVYELDSSCRIAIGFYPKGSEPGLCFTPLVPAQPEAGGASCVAYGGSCTSDSDCCSNVPCSGGLCRFN